VSETGFEFTREIYGIIIALLGTGGVSGWLLTRYKYNREKDQRKAHLKAKLLDDVLFQCRSIEQILNNYQNELKKYKKYLDDGEIDSDTGFPKNIFDIETESRYRDYLNSIKNAKEFLRHKHQNYVIKTKSNEIEVLNSIDESLTKMINYEYSPSFDYKAANIEYLEVYTNLRMVHHHIKKVYPEEVPID